MRQGGREGGDKSFSTGNNYKMMAEWNESREK